MDSPNLLQASPPAGLNVDHCCSTVDYLLWFLLRRHEYPNRKDNGGLIKTLFLIVAAAWDCGTGLSPSLSKRTVPVLPKGDETGSTDAAFLRVHRTGPDVILASEFTVTFPTFLRGVNGWSQLVFAPKGSPSMEKCLHGRPRGVRRQGVRCEKAELKKKVITWSLHRREWKTIRRDRLFDLINSISSDLHLMRQQVYAHDLWILVQIMEIRNRCPRWARNIRIITYWTFFFAAPFHVNSGSR